MNNDKKEIRNVTYPVQVTGQDDQAKRTVEGYALLFDTPSDGLSFEEVIERGALDGVIAKSDVLALMNHSLDRGVLARSTNGAGSLTLEVDEKGLLYRFEAPHTPLGDELLENLRRGEVSSSSFCFTSKKDTWEERSDGTWKRTIHQIDELFDVSPVYNAAYSATSVYTRGRDEIIQKREAELKANLEGYYKAIENSLNF